MGIYKGQNIIAGSYMLPRADDNRQVNISRKRMHKKREEQEKKEDEGREDNNTAKNKEAGSILEFFVDFFICSFSYISP
jgi:hypothetical protein